MNSTTNKHATRIALFAGSFDPFTRGHKDIVDRALATVADKVVIAIGINCQRKGQRPSLLYIKTNRGSAYTPTRDSPQTMHNKSVRTSCLEV